MSSERSSVKACYWIPPTAWDEISFQSAMDLINADCRKLAHPRTSHWACMCRDAGSPNSLFHRPAGLVQAKSLNPRAFSLLHTLWDAASVLWAANTVSDAPDERERESHQTHLSELKCLKWLRIRGWHDKKKKKMSAQTEYGDVGLLYV